MDSSIGTYSLTSIGLEAQLRPGHFWPGGIMAATHSGDPDGALKGPGWDPTLPRLWRSPSASQVIVRSKSGPLLIQVSEEGGPGQSLRGLGYICLDILL